jgi:hypothetical protein
MPLIPLLLLAVVDIAALWYVPPIGAVLTLLSLCILDGA